MKFTPKHSTITIELKYLQKSNNGANFAICVSDEGIGISP
jgi:signal transduction histidine kinase